MTKLPEPNFIDRDPDIITKEWIEKFEEKCCGYEKEHNVSVIRINDGEGVFIEEEVYICRL